MEKKVTEKKTHTVDATGMILGRLASQVAKLLQGKDTPGFQKHILSGASVTVTNASKIKMSEKRKNETLHEKYTGYPGGLYYRTNAQIIEKKGYAELVRLAVYGMLPGNRLRAQMMKKLTIKE